MCRVAWEPRGREEGVGSLDPELEMAVSTVWVLGIEPDPGASRQPPLFTFECWLISDFLYMCVCVCVLASAGARRGWIPRSWRLGSCAGAVTPTTEPSLQPPPPSFNIVTFNFNVYLFNNGNEMQTIVALLSSSCF